MKTLKHNGNALGLISEDGCSRRRLAFQDPHLGGAETQRAVRGDQVHTGTKTWTFTLIELSAENMIQVMGGTTEDTGIYVPPTEDKDVQGVFDIETVTGHTIRIYNGVLTCNFANGINFSNVLGIECELEIQEAGRNLPTKCSLPDRCPPPVKFRRSYDGGQGHAVPGGGHAA